MGDAALSLGMSDDMAYPEAMDGQVAEVALGSREDPDAADVQRFLGGDESAFEALVARHEAEVFRIAMRLLRDREDAMEATQEVFLRVFRSLRKFRGEASFRTWLYGIAINACRNRLSSASRRNRESEIPLEVRVGPGDDAVDLPLPSPRPDPEAEVAGRELGHALEGALARLPGEQREAFLLREAHGMEYEQIAAVLDCAVGTVKSRLARARDALRASLKGVWP